MTEGPNRRNADEAKGENAQQRKKAYRPPELVKRGRLANVAAFTPVVPAAGGGGGNDELR